MASYPDLKIEKTTDKKIFLSLLIFFIAFFYRLLYLYQIKQTPLFYNLVVDQEYFYLWAIEIANGDWVGKELFTMSPLYPYLMAFVIKVLSKDLFIVRIMQLFVGSLSCVLIFSITKSVFKKNGIAFIAGVISGIYGPFIFHDAMIMKTFLALFFTLLLARILLETEKPLLRYPFFCGAIIGLAAMAAQNIMLLIPLIILFFISRRKSNSLNFLLKKCAVFVFGIILVVSPVTIRNYFVGSQFVLITTVGGENFYLANNPEADGYYRPPKFVKPHPFYEHENFRKVASEFSGRELSFMESSDFWYSKGLEYIKENPGRFFQLLLKKFLIFWNFYEVPDNDNYYFFKTFSTLIDKASVDFRIVSPFGILGLILAFRHRREAAVLYLVFFGYLASFIIFFNLDRYRVPLIPFVIIFAAYAIHWLAIKFKDRKFLHVGMFLTLFGVLFFLCNYRVQGIGHFAYDCDECYARLGTAYAKAGNPKEAISAYKTAIELNPDFEINHNGLGMIYLEEGMFSQAEEEFKKAILIEPKMGEAHYNLGTTLMNQGKIDEAIFSLRKAVKYTFLPLFLKSIHNNLGNAYAKKEEYEEAINEYKKALAIDPTHQNSLKNFRIIEKKLLEKKAFN